MIETDGRYGLDDVSVVMGAYNEREAIEPVLDEIDEATDGQAAVVVVDSSTDGTADLARENGATVVEQPPQGYGVAVREALLSATNPVRITTDCDGTYPMECIPDFLDLINEGYDVVSGDRLYHGARTMPTMNRFGNHAFVALASGLMTERVHDVTTGMRAYRGDLIEQIEWTENTGLSAELLLRPVMRGYRVREEPIEYDERLGETKLDPFTGGAEIAKSIVKVCLEERGLL